MFEPIVRDVFHRAFGVSDGGAAIERTMKADYKNHLMGRALVPLGSSMSNELDRAIRENISCEAAKPGEWITVGLCDYIVRVLFQASVETLFGRGGYTRERFDEFAKWDESVGTILAGIPPTLLGLSRARQVLWDMFSSEDIRGRDEMSSLIKIRSTTVLNTYKSFSDVQGILVL